MRPKMRQGREQSFNDGKSVRRSRPIQGKREGPEQPLHCRPRPPTGRLSGLSRHWPRKRPWSRSYVLGQQSAQGHDAYRASLDGGRRLAAPCRNGVSVHPLPNELVACHGRDPDGSLTSLRRQCSLSLGGGSSLPPALLKDSPHSPLMTLSGQPSFPGSLNRMRSRSIDLLR
jgi:hypothetical protein